MGLDTSHDAWHGAYSAFSRWRDKVAEAAGYEIMPGHTATFRDGSSDYIRDLALIDWGHITEANLYGDWDETPTDPLIVLIAHSDCDGVIHPEQAAPLADRLEGLLPLLPDREGAGHMGDWRDTTRQFIDGLRAAVAAGDDLDFH